MALLINIWQPARYAHVLNKNTLSRMVLTVYRKAVWWTDGVVGEQKNGQTLTFTISSLEYIDKSDTFNFCWISSSWHTFAAQVITSSIHLLDDSIYYSQPQQSVGIDSTVSHGGGSPSEPSLITYDIVLYFLHLDIYRGVGSRYLLRPISIMSKMTPAFCSNNGIAYNKDNLCVCLFK